MGKIIPLTKTNLKISLLAIPITLLLFILFPRIPGPLWTLPNLSKSGTTGLSDSMYPGSVNKLSDSSEIVFRIDFKDKIPKASNLYWRGPVLTETNGFLWKQKKQVAQLSKNNFQKQITETKNPINYTITLEPQKQKWLFTLEMGSSISSQFVNNAYLSNDMQFLVKQPLTRVVQYNARSNLKFKFNATNSSELEQATQYPTSSNPQTLQLGKQWRKIADKNNLSDLELIEKALNFFIQENFYYTRKPSVMTKNPSDQFLFEYKRGFCEHFASSFVLLMRAAGMPARVVTGYQGIEYNKIGKYFLVRQSNAHAWAEIWVKDKGWTRVDPTAIIPQDHIENDIFDYKSNELSFLNLNYSNIQKLAQSLAQNAWFENTLNKVKQSIDILKYSWNNWVLSYDKNKQQTLLTWLGLNNNIQTLILLITVLSLGVIAIYFYLNLIKIDGNNDKLLQLYLSFLSKLKKQGLNYTQNEGPESLKRKSIKLLPYKAKQLEKIFDYYIQLRYCKPTPDYTIKRFKQLLNQNK